jgi:2',3'-cyclic-nucleotide 2'-phosphodiesterase (5'-nucleotidase family)
LKIAFYITFFATFFICCKPTSYGVKEKSGSVNIVKNTPSTYHEIDTIIAPYRTQLNEKMDVVINQSMETMTTGSPQGLLGNFVTDLCLKLIIDSLKLEKDNISMVILNNGGLRTHLPKGDITLRKVFEIMPFENELVIVEISGANFRDAIKTIASKCESRDNAKGCIPFSGVEITANKTEGNVLVNNLPIDTISTHKILTSDYLANGGDNMYFLSSAISTVYTNIKLRDAIIYHLKKESLLGNKITGKTDNRIRYVE